MFKPLLDEGVNEGVSEGVSEGVTRLLILIRQNPGQRTPFFETATGSPCKTIERWLKQLKDQSAIEFRGAHRTGGYFVTNIKSVGR